MNVKTYEKLGENIGNGEAALNLNHGEETAKLQEQLRRNRQRYESNVCNKILNIYDTLFTEEELAAGTKCPILLFGDGRFSQQ